MTTNANAAVAATSLIECDGGEGDAMPDRRRRGSDQAPAIPALLTAEEVATQLGCQPEQINALAAAHALPAVKFGRSWRFPASALHHFLHQQALAHLKSPAPHASNPATPQPTTRKRGGPADLRRTVKVV